VIFDQASSSSPSERALNALHSGIALSDWEQTFLRDLAGRARLSAKQEAKLSSIERRASRDTVDPVVAFLDAMEAAGVVPAEPIADLLGPDKIRFQCNGDRKGRKNGWAKFYDDGLPAGSFGNYKLNIAQTWHLDDGRELSAEERKRLAEEGRAKAAARAAAREALQVNIADQCRMIWNAAGPVDPAHAYLVKKQIVGEGLRQLDDDALQAVDGMSLAMFDKPGDVWRNLAGALLVPMFDDVGQLWNLQRIFANGSKLYVKDGRSDGLHMHIGEQGGEIAVAEGYGNAAVIRRATGLSVAVAYCWRNLEHVARFWRERLPDADIIIAADDDAHLLDHPQIQRNIGLDAATAAAQAVGGRVAIPPRRAAQ
jgi:putative DNA primase/helicase